MFGRWSVPHGKLAVWFVLEEYPALCRASADTGRGCGHEKLATVVSSRRGEARRRADLRHDGAHYVTVQLTRPLADLWECFRRTRRRAETVIDRRLFPTRGTLPTESAQRCSNNACEDTR